LKEELTAVAIGLVQHGDSGSSHLWIAVLMLLDLPHLSFHCTRVTVVTRIARKGYCMAQAKAYVGHASDTVHAIYQRLTPPDVCHLGAVLSNPIA